MDDKIINKANEEGVSASEISEKYILEYFKDADALGVNRATHHPKVTETMDEIIEFIKVLEDKGYAYESKGDVFFDSVAFNGYGKLSGQNIEELDSGSRIDVDARKNIHQILFCGRQKTR